MRERRKRLLVDGLVAGVLGYAIVAVFFAAINVLTGHPVFYTAALLGEATFGGLRDAGGASMDPGLMLAFNGVQLVAMLAFGFLAAWLIYETELHPEVWYVALFAFLAAALAGSGAVAAATVLSGRLVSPWIVLVASLLALAGMAGYLAAGHRPLLRLVQETGGMPGTTG